MTLLCRTPNEHLIENQDRASPELPEFRKVLVQHI